MGVLFVFGGVTFLSGTGGGVVVWAPVSNFLFLIRSLLGLGRLLSGGASLAFQSAGVLLVLLKDEVALVALAVFTLVIEVLLLVVSLMVGTTL